MDVGYRYLGNYSAVDPAYSRSMSCDDCKVSWTGCWDNFQCPLCGQGELPSTEINDSSYLDACCEANEPSNERLQENLEELKRLHVELRGILDELEEMVR
jgi:hypothetical protein